MKIFNTLVFVSLFFSVQALANFPPTILCGKTKKLCPAQEGFVAEEWNVTKEEAKKDCVEALSKQIEEWALRQFQCARCEIEGGCQQEIVPRWNLATDVEQLDCSQPDHGLGWDCKCTLKVKASFDAVCTECAEGKCQD